MTDLEKVIKGLECCLMIDTDCEKCPYLDTVAERIEREIHELKGTPGDDLAPLCYEILRGDTLELLKAQEPVQYTYNFDAEPICGACGAVVDGVDNYCRNCGRKVAWE